ncbi:MAG: hypothetical protein MUF52_13600 [Syntrophobacteraceae bacterium]|jgi:hypothetical protein|nr:hypothetical protein [Syntrophobacteraceae bacterium]
MGDRNTAKTVAIAVLAMTLLLICWAMFSFLSAPPDRQTEGFQGMAWAANIRDLPELKLIGEDGDQKFYVREGESLEIHGIVADNVVYGFYRGRFYSVMVYFSSMASFNQVRDRLAREHGSPFRHDESGLRLFWTSGKVHILLTYDEPLSQGRISYFYQPIESEIEQDEKSRGGAPSAPRS